MKTFTLEVTSNEKQAIYSALTAAAESGDFSSAVHTEQLQQALRNDETCLNLSGEQVSTVLKYLHRAIELAEGRADDWARASDIKSARESLISKIRSQFAVFDNISQV